jgi:hypothetical protein
MGKLKLTVSKEKTAICQVPDERLASLGYTSGRYDSYRTGRLET